MFPIWKFEQQRSYSSTTLIDKILNMNVLKRNNVTVFGEGTQPIVFSNGFGCDQNVWREVTPHFEKDYKIVLFDHVGTGKSDINAYSSAKYEDLKDYARDIVEICEALALKDAIFVGHSVSAMIGVLAYKIAPHFFDRLVLIGPSPRYINEGDYTGGFEKEDIEELLDMLSSNYMGWSSAMAPVVMGNPDRPELGEGLTDSFCQMDPKIAEKFAQVTFLSDNRADLKNVAIPTAILQCKEDVIAPQVVGQYVNEHIKGSEYFEINATGHCPNLSAAEEVVRVIKEFLGEVKTPQMP